MDQQEIIQFVAALPCVVAVTASEKDGAPESAWGDSFFFYDPEGDTPANHRFPFATIVISNYEGFDEASQLDRQGIFRLNISVGREAYRRLLGHRAEDHASHSTKFDYAAIDRLLPHPVYASQGWVSILNPDDATSAVACTLLTDAHGAAVRRHDRRKSTG